MTTLFFPDNAARFAVADLRAAARSEVENSPLIQRAWYGDLEAARALHIGFWGFVFEFEKAIDAQIPKMPRDVLLKRFSRKVVGRVILDAAKALREMQQEEGQHSLAWLDDAKRLGLKSLKGPKIAGVQALIASAYTLDMPKLFAVLAGTEFIAEELSHFLLMSRHYRDLFDGRLDKKSGEMRRTWIWGEIHAAGHEPDEVSHLLLDLDLARAYCPDDDVSPIERMIMDTITLFGKAAIDVADTLLPPDGPTWRVHDSLLDNLVAAQSSQAPLQVSLPA